MHSISLIAEDALLIRFGQTDKQDTKANTVTQDALAAEQVAALVELIQSHYSEYCRDLIPAYSSLTVIVDFPKILPQTFATLLIASIKALEVNFGSTQTKAEATAHTKPLITLPCYYGAEVAYDLDELAQITQLSRDTVIHLHSQNIYQVYAIGFSPGFPYLGFVDERIACPRKTNPRTHVPAGSVGIADKQTGVYPQNTPGGWQIIGRCPLALFQPKAKNIHDICRLKTGDSVKFEAIDRERYIELGGQFDDT